MLVQGQRGGRSTGAQVERKALVRRTLREPWREKGPAVGADDGAEEDSCFNHSF